VKDIVNRKSKNQLNVSANARDKSEYEDDEYYDEESYDD
jgi:hypothetical protein